jgi:hypothetical protein
MSSNVIYGYWQYTDMTSYNGTGEVISGSWGAACGSIVGRPMSAYFESFALAVTDRDTPCWFLSWCHIHAVYLISEKYCAGHRRCLDISSAGQNSFPCLVGTAGRYEVGDNRVDVLFLQFLKEVM